MRSLPLIAASAFGLYILLSGEGTKASNAAVVKGASGTTWRTVIAKAADQWLYTSVYSAARLVLTFRQRGNDKSSRALVSYPPGVPSTLLATARKDFGV